MTNAGKQVWNEFYFTNNHYLEDDDDDGDGIADIHDSDDDGDGLNDDDGEATSPKKAAKARSESGPWSTIVFGYFFGLTTYILKTAWSWKHTVSFWSFDLIKCKIKLICNV